VNEAIAWATFAGAWLLVAGPLYQGSVELSELDFDRAGKQVGFIMIPHSPHDDAWGVTRVPLTSGWALAATWVEGLLELAAAWALLLLAPAYPKPATWALN